MCERYGMRVFSGEMRVSLMQKQNLLRISIFFAVNAGLAGQVRAEPWKEDLSFFDDDVHIPSFRADAADINGDGFIDLVYANIGSEWIYMANAARAQQAYLHQGVGKAMLEAGDNIFGASNYNGREVKIRDIDNDGHNDIMLGTSWETQSQIFFNFTDGTPGKFANRTATNLPQMDMSVADIEFGDVDEDGDLDMVLVDWGDGVKVDTYSSVGLTRLWLQEGVPDGDGVGSGKFIDRTEQMPQVFVGMSFDLELVDADNDYDLDIIVSANFGPSLLYLFEGDGLGNFVDITAEALPNTGAQLSEVEAIDVNDDGHIDLLTMIPNKILLNDTHGKFFDGTDEVWPPEQNPSEVEMNAVFVDLNSDHAVDFLLGSYSRSLFLDEGGQFVKQGSAFKDVESPPGNPMWSVLADFNKDGRVDVAQARAEGGGGKQVFIAQAEVPVDSAGPVIMNHDMLGLLQFGDTVELRVRAHDNKSPLMVHDFKLENGHEGLPHIEYWTSNPGDDPLPGERSAPGQWYGEYLWRIGLVVPDADSLWYRICAADAVGNWSCTDVYGTNISGNTPEPDLSTASGDAAESESEASTDPSGTTMVFPATSASASTEADESVSTGSDVPTTSATAPTSATAIMTEDPDTDGPNGGDLSPDDGACVCNADRGGLRLGTLAMFLMLLYRRRRVLRA